MKYIYIVYLLAEGEKEPVGIYNSFASAKARVMEITRHSRVKWLEYDDYTWVAGDIAIYIDMDKLL